MKPCERNGIFGIRDVNFKLNGNVSVESNIIGSGKLTYITNLVKLMLGWKIVSVSVFAWAGLLGFIFLLVKYFKGNYLQDKIKVS